MKIWRWKYVANEQHAAIEQTEKRVQKIESNWDIVRAEVAKARQHRERNHIADLIIGVARGNR